MRRFVFIWQPQFGFFGTPSTMAPEMFAFEEHHTPADVWSLGVLPHPHPTLHPASTTSPWAPSSSPIRSHRCRNAAAVGAAARRSVRRRDDDEARGGRVCVSAACGALRYFGMAGLPLGRRVGRGGQGGGALLRAQAGGSADDIRSLKHDLCGDRVSTLCTATDRNN